jgi:hypothetical protein
MSTQADYTPTPDRRYFVVRGRLWCLSNPSLDKEIHSELVQELMIARHAVRDGKNSMERIAVCHRFLANRGTNIPTLPR